MKNLIALLILISLLGGKQTLAQVHRDKAKEKAQQLMQAFLLAPESPPGISVAVKIGDQIIYSEGFGYTQVERGEKVSPNTRFRAASVSKMMTATALAKLYQEEKLDFEKPVDFYVPNFPKKAHSYNVAQLSGHIAGFPHYSFSDKIQKRFYPSVTEALGTFAHQKLLFEPGTTYKYSTHGYTLLSAVVEGASGKEFLEYLHTEIFAPLNMDASGPDLRHDVHEDMTALYKIQKSGKAILVQKPQDPSYKWGGGGMTSSPKDLVNMGSAYYSGFFEEAVVARIFQSQKMTSGKETHVGIGWRSNIDPFGRQVFEHAGAMEGTRSVISIFPEEKLAVSIMGNARRPHMIEESAHVLASLFLSEEKNDPGLQGSTNIEFIRRGFKKDIKGKGTLRLAGDTGSLSIKNGDKKPITYKLIKLFDKDLYALLTEFGILFCQIKAEGAAIKGSAILYGSMRAKKPAFKDAFIEFAGDFAKN